MDTEEQDRLDAATFERIGSAWSDDRVESLKCLWDLDLPVSKIATILGPRYTRKAVLAKIRRLGLEKRNKPPVHPFTEEMAAFGKEGLEAIVLLKEDIARRSSNMPVYTAKALIALDQLEGAFEAFLEELVAPLRSNKNIGIDHIKNVGQRFAGTVRASVVSGVTKLKQEAGYVSLVGMIGYMISATGNSELAAAVVAILLGTDVTKN